MNGITARDEGTVTAPLSSVPPDNPLSTGTPQGASPFRPHDVSTNEQPAFIPIPRGREGMSSTESF